MASDFTKLYKRWSTGAPRKEDMKFICTKRTYTKDLSVDMDTILSDVDSFLGFAPFIPSDIHEKLTVYLDDTEERTITVSIAHLRKVLALYEKELMSLEQENAQNSEEIEKLRSLINSIKSLIAGASGSSVTITTSILGHYKRAGLDGKPEISLMKRALEGEPELAAIVYVHELMHAYYDMHNIEHPHIPEIEEPLAEYGMLCLMEMFQRFHPEYVGLFDKASKHVESKKYSLGTCHYGYGAFLFKDRVNVSVDWVSLFHSVCFALGENSEDLKTYRETISPVMYPHSERLSEKILFKALIGRFHFESVSKVHKANGSVYFSTANIKNDTTFQLSYPSTIRIRFTLTIIAKSGDVISSAENEASIYQGTQNLFLIGNLKTDFVNHFGSTAGIRLAFREITPASSTTFAKWIAREL